MSRNLEYQNLLIYRIEDYLITIENLQKNPEILEDEYKDIKRRK